MKFKVKKYSNHIEAGEYIGHISEIFTGTDDKYVGMRIITEGSDVIYSTSLAFNSVIFQQFSVCYMDENGIADTDDMQGSLIRFTVEDRETSNDIISKIVKIEPMSEE